MAISMMALGCGAEKGAVPPPDSPQPPQEAPTVVDTPPERPSRILGEVPAGKLRLAWSTDTNVWNRCVDISPSGDVLSVGAGRIHLHARDTGEVLESIDTCYVASRRGAAFVTQDRIVLACMQRVLEVTVPGLSTRTVVEHDELSTATAVSKQGVAYAMRGGEVRVLRTEGYRDWDRFSVGGDVEELAFSADGRLLAVGLRDGRVFVRVLGTGGVREVAEGNRRATGLAFVEDGSLLFLHNERFVARVVETADGKEVRKHRAGPWISAASSLGNGWFAASGSGGITIYRKDAEEGTKLDPGDGGPTSSCEGLDVSPDGTLLCTGDRKGRVVCYTTREQGG